MLFRSHPYISIWSSYRPVHSRIRQFARYGEHSNRGYFIDPWPIGNTVCLQTAFGRRCGGYGCSRPLSWGFVHRLCGRCTPTEGRRFRALPRHSTCRITSYPNNGILLFVRRLFTASERVALSQKGSELCAWGGVVFWIRLEINCKTSLSSCT